MHRLAINYSDFDALADDILSSGGSFQFIATGNSMWPFVRNGAQLTVTKADPGSLRKGDIVLYKSGELLAVHRVVKKTRNDIGYLFHIQGDGCFDNGETVEEDCVIGHVIGVEQDGVFLSKRIIRSIMFVELVRKIRQILWYVKVGSRLVTRSGVQR